jgi:hypothetical protein
VVEARAVIGITDIHARSFPDRIEAFEDLDRLGVILGWVFTGWFSHRRRPRIG